MYIDAVIPSGRISVKDATEPTNIVLEVPKDPGSPLMGWYHFRASGVRGIVCRYRMTNAGEISGVRLPHREKFEDRWTNTGPLASYDLQSWFRIPAKYDGMEFSFEHSSERDICYYAAFAPFPPERDQALLARAAASDRVEIRTLGRSVQGRPIDMISIGRALPGRKICWVIARQHPSETQGGFFIEGMLSRLLDRKDASAARLLDKTVIHIVPNMNPDGSANGLSRTNTLGVNLNREWLAPTAERSPEVLYVRNEMECTGLDFCIDLHADAELNFNFVWPSENVPGWHAGRRELFDHFERAWSAASPDYGLGEAYPGGVPEKADLSMGWNWIGHRFPEALSVLLEQPFKDVHNRRVPETGWTPQRATDLGRSFVDALSGVADHLPARHGKGATA